MKNFRITQSITNRQDESLKLFFRDVSKIPMISMEEEIELSKRIKRGDSVAIHKLVEANLRFVISVAKQYQNKGIPLVDLIQSGSIGLIEAAKRWDDSRGFKFISYAVWWIRQSILQSISAECRTIRIPMNQVASMTKLIKASEKLEQELERSPSVEELEKETELPTDKINLTLSSINKAVSLDTPFKDDEEAGCLLDVIPNDSINHTDSNLVQESISNEIENALMSLTNRESDVIRMLFGIGTSVMTFEEIAGRFGLCTERVRQIQCEALDKLKKLHGDTLKELL